ncbi:MAG: hypothetical protein AB6733_24540 [Clostridiaceae bacterium]
MDKNNNKIWINKRICLLFGEISNNYKKHGEMSYMEKKINYDINLEIDGMGIIFYSDGAVENIKEGENFLRKEYENPDQVAKHIRKGDIVGFCTGSGGDYILKFRDGYPSEEIDERYPISIRLGIVIDGGRLCIKDLFELIDWDSYCPKEQQIQLEDGAYHITLNTRRPKSGIYGDYQEIYVFLNKLDKMPKLMWEGVPQLFEE